MGMIVYSELFFMSQELSPAQTKYTAMELECLAVLLAIEKFRPFIEGVEFTVITETRSNFTSKMFFVRV